MPASPNRLLHGMGHPRLPSNAIVTPTGVVAKSSSGGAAAASAAPNVVPVAVLDAFYQMLPSPNIQQQAISKENRFSANDLNDGLIIGTYTTRDQQVYIWTDVRFYALVPGIGMNSPPVSLTEYQLSGLIRFVFTINNVSPMNLIADTESPYTDPNFPLQGDLTGWQKLNNNFGSTRYGSAFALYARSQQVTTITMMAVQRNRFPRFSIDRIGFELHGYVAPEADFDSIWRKTIGVKK